MRYNYEAFIKRVLIGLGFEEAVWDKTAEHFSGGQKTRMMLAAALVRQPDFLILDEPTNHLDIAKTEWLEKYLQEFKGGLLVVSQDSFNKRFIIISVNMFVTFGHTGVFL